ncbi:hypothetical protein ABZX85_37030 [Streptomyces sp. NPDC004539]|uniref:hypothetical protein n=1 Tax=Streptomyces sp. NPDC004539 TaxID=3154280 RepID=UPI0033A77295
MKNSPARQEWEAAVLRLFEDEYSFVASGPRVHESWLTDVLAVMARRTTDPRGWVTLDWDKEENARDSRRDVSFPFHVVAEDRLGEILREITPELAERFVVLLTDEWFKVGNIPNFAERKEGILADARTLLARYGSECSYYATVGEMAEVRDSDFFPRFTGESGMTDYLMDLGLVAVSPSEVGVVWRFNAH